MLISEARSFSVKKVFLKKLYILFYRTPPGNCFCDYSQMCYSQISVSDMIYNMLLHLDWVEKFDCFRLFSEILGDYW